MPYSSIYHPIALTDFTKRLLCERVHHFNVTRTISPVIGSPMRTTRPASLTSNAMELARLTDVVFRLIL